MKVTSPIQFEIFPQPRPSPEEIIERCNSFNPVARFALYSGGDDSLVTTHWLMSNGHCDEVLSIDTGIGLKITRRHIRETCARFGWPLVEVRAKEDCGQDYRKIVLKHGFPGPPKHREMYIQLKERAIEKIVRERKVARSRQKVLLATGIRQDESQWRAGYGGQEVTTKAGQLWANPFYWISSSDFHHYRVEHNLPRGPASITLGMSGECLCGAYAEPGELAAIRLIEPETADEIEQLERDVAARGHCWRWEERPPKSVEVDERQGEIDFRPMCMGCPKTEVRVAA
jgi:hypothetical protein